MSINLTAMENFLNILAEDPEACAEASERFIRIFEHLAANTDIQDRLFAATKNSPQMKLQIQMMMNLQKQVKDLKTQLAKTSKHIDGLGQMFALLITRIDPDLAKALAGGINTATTAPGVTSPMATPEQG